MSTLTHLFLLSSWTTVFNICLIALFYNTIYRRVFSVNDFIFMNIILFTVSQARPPPNQKKGNSVNSCEFCSDQTIT